MRDHSRNSMTAGSVGSIRRRQCGSVRSAEARTRASRRSSFAPAGREAVPEAVELLRIDRVQHEAAFHQALDHRPARRLDRYADLARLVSRREGQQPVGHLRQPRATMLERPLPAHLPGGVEHAHLMGLRPPVDTREPCQLQSNLPFCRSTGPPTMSAGPCTGAPRRKLPTGHPSVADRRGTCPPPGAQNTGGAWWLPAACPTPRDQPREVVQKGTGGCGADRSRGVAGRRRGLHEPDARRAPVLRPAPAGGRTLRGVPWRLPGRRGCRALRPGRGDSAVRGGQGCVLGVG